MQVTDYLESREVFKIEAKKTSKRKMYVAWLAFHIWRQLRMRLSFHVQARCACSYSIDTCTRKSCLAKFSKKKKEAAKNRANTLASWLAAVKLAKAMMGITCFQMIFRESFFNDSGVVRCLSFV